jgi:YfiR/HmsC-like
MHRMRLKTTARGFFSAARPPVLRIRLALLLELLCGLFAPVLLAQARPSADEMKAAYLFNFGKFVSQPATSPQPADFDICVLGHDPILPVLERLTLHEHIDDRPVRIKQYDKAADARACAIVYLGASEASRIDQDLAALQGADVLTVGELPQFLEHGGMLQFLLQGNRIRFAVNLNAVGRSNLHLSSELLRVAASVSGRPHAEMPQ